MNNYKTDWRDTLRHFSNLAFVGSYLLFERGMVLPGACCTVTGELLLAPAQSSTGAEYSRCRGRLLSACPWNDIPFLSWLTSAPFWGLFCRETFRRSFLLLQVVAPLVFPLVYSQSGMISI